MGWSGGWGRADAGNMPAGRRGVVDQASDHPPAGAITHPAGGHSPRWRTGGSAPAGGEGAAGPGAADRSGGARPPADYLLSSVVSFSTRRSTSSATVPVVGRSHWPASSDSSFLVRPA